jgi:hypothetical protein
VIGATFIRRVESISAADDVEMVSECPVCRGESFARLPVPGRRLGPEQFKDLIRDTFLGMGLRENLGVVARL